MATSGEPPLPVALYVHVPFCVSKCAYCDFFSVAGHAERFGAFVDAALFEAGHWSHYDLLDDVPSLYFGGGTPTALGPELLHLVDGVLQTAALRPGAEITVETNPETTEADLVGALVAAGVNRFSLGVQSFDDAVLRTLGRCHDAARAEAAAATLAATGSSLSIDLICGVPGQSFASWDDTLERAVATGARHVSVYPLSIEEGTPISRAITEGRVAEPDPDLAAEMMLAAEVALAAAGLHRYEVANYAQPGHESRHNTAYWTGVPYVGIGPGAASMLPHDPFATIAACEGWQLPAGTPEPARVRFTRGHALDAYLRHPLASPGPFEVLSRAEMVREDVMLGMRLREGVAAEDVDAASLTSVFERLEREGLVRLERTSGSVARWAVTQRGWMLGNEVFGSIWAGE